MTKLDLKDKKILYELDLNSRQSFHQIAKKVGLSKDSIIYRVNKLKQDGIIKQFHTVIDVNKLGYISFRLYLKLQNTTPKKEQEIINFLKKQKIVVWMVSIDGKYDLGIWALTKSLRNMNDLWKRLLDQYVNYIDERWLTILTDVKSFPRSFLLDQKQNLEEFDYITSNPRAEVDAKDIEIIRILAPDSRISCLEVAKRVGLTPKTVISRIKILEEKKVIVGYRTRFDMEKIGYQYFKLQIDLQNTTREEKLKFRQFVKQHPNIIHDEKILGGNDLDIELQVKGIKEYREILEEIKAKFSKMIKDHRHMIFYKEHKNLFFPV
jgi:DNA-binding Lrp family transcriptional regulator